MDGLEMALDCTLVAHRYPIIVLWQHTLRSM